MFTDWIGFILGLLGSILIARKNKYCWYICAASNISWIIYSIITKQLALLLECGVLLLINIYAWLKWNKVWRKVIK